MWLFIITHFLFSNRKSKHDFYRGIDCMKKFSADLRKHATEINKCEKRKDMIKQKCCHLCREEFNDMFSEDENRLMVWYHFNYTRKYCRAAHSICSLR